MAENAEARLAALGVVLPVPPAPAASYIPTVTTGQLVFVSGQVSILGDEKYVGKLGREHGVEDGQKAARICAINILAQIKAALGDLEQGQAHRQAGRLRQLHARFHRPAPGDQRLLRFPHRGARRARQACPLGRRRGDPAARRRRRGRSHRRGRLTAQTARGGSVHVRTRLADGAADRAPGLSRPCRRPHREHAAGRRGGNRARFRHRMRPAADRRRPRRRLP